MLIYLPRLYPDESFYSLFARLRRDLCLSQEQACQKAFGRFTSVSAQGLQMRLAEFAAHVHPDRGLDPDTLIAQTTSWNYFSAFATPERADQARQLMLDGTGKSLWSALSLTRRGIELNSQLRFCPACREEMNDQFGEVYWCRSHQLPGVLICPKHHCPLWATSINARERGHFISIAASREIFDAGTPMLGSDVPEAVQRLLLDIAQRSAQLLRAEPRHVEVGERSAVYRQRLTEAGLTRAAIVRSTELGAAFQSFVKPIVELVPDVAFYQHPRIASSNCWTWLKVEANPLRVIGFEIFLDSLRPGDPEDSLEPFGPGPWDCRNPLHAGGQPAVRNFQLVHGLSRRDALVGRFTCPECGFSYVRNSQTGEVRIVDRGPAFREQLVTLAASGASTIRLSRMLHAPVGEVALVANALGVELPPRRTGPRWRNRRSTAALKGELCAVRAAHPEADRAMLRTLTGYAINRLSVEDPDWLEQNLPPKKLRVTKEPRSEFDQALAQRIVDIAHGIRRSEPPRRASRRQIILATGCKAFRKRPWREIYTPEAHSILNREAESVRDFQQRRADWAVAKLRSDSQPLNTTNVIHLAGLQSSRHKAIALGAIERVAPLD